MEQRKSNDRILPSLQPWQRVSLFIAGLLVVLGGLARLFLHEHSGGMWNTIGDGLPFLVGLALLMPRLVLRIVEGVLAKFAK
jgi:hypothetical protein